MNEDWARQIVEQLHIGVLARNLEPMPNAGSMCYTLRIFCNAGNSRKQFDVELEVQRNNLQTHVTAVYMKVTGVVYLDAGGSYKQLDAPVVGKNVVVTSCPNDGVLEPQRVEPVMDAHYRITGTVKLEQ